MKKIREEEIKNFMNKNTIPPHCLMELSFAGWYGFKDNYIALAGLSRKNDEVTYSGVVYGANFVTENVCTICNGEEIRWTQINLSKMRSRCIYITVSKAECEIAYKGTIVFDVSDPKFEGNMGYAEYDPSGIVILSICYINNHNDPEGRTWGREDYDKLKRCKENIINENSTHHGSSGKYYSFGNKANYAIIEKSSVSQYVSKPYKNDGRNTKSKV